MQYHDDDQFLYKFSHQIQIEFHHKKQQQQTFREREKNTAFGYLTTIWLTSFCVNFFPLHSHSVAVLVVVTSFAHRTHIQIENKI